MSELKKYMDFMENHFIKITVLIFVVLTLLFGVSCYSFNKALDAYNEKNKVEKSK